MYLLCDVRYCIFVHEWLINELLVDPYNVLIYVIFYNNLFELKNNYIYYERIKEY